MTRTRNARGKSIGRPGGKRTKIRAAAKMPRQAPSVTAVQKATIDTLTRELAEAREQQIATSQVLGIISSSPGELEPVFESILANAVRLCGAKFGNLWLYDDDVFRIGATHGAPPPYREFLRREPVIRAAPDNNFGRMLKTKHAVQVEDLRAQAKDNLRRESVKLAGMRSLVLVPMIRNGKVIGAVAIYGQEVRPFTDKQIELVTNFAAQAVIAIENARLLNELRQRTEDLTESLQQQTATSEVLKVISSSPGELSPVFDTLLSNATNICDAKFGNLFIYEDGVFKLMAMHNAPPAYAEARRREPVRPPLAWV